MSGSAIASILRDLDRDRYFSTLILREPHRAAIQSLYAFNAEIAAIPARVSEPGPGEIRLQWWRDALEGREHGSIGQNPVAAALMGTIEHYRLPKGPLVRLIAARRFDLYQDPMPDLLTFDGYAGETASVLYQFAAMILNKGEPVADGNAAGHLGVAHALIGHMRAFSHNAARARIFLPMNVFKAHGVGEGDILSGKDIDAVRAAFGQFADLATGHLTTARAAISGLPRDLRPAFAMAPVLVRQLRLTAASPNPFYAPSDLPDWRKIIALVFGR